MSIEQATHSPLPRDEFREALLDPSNPCRVGARGGGPFESSSLLTRRQMLRLMCAGFGMVGLAGLIGPQSAFAASALTMASAHAAITCRSMRLRTSTYSAVWNVATRTASTVAGPKRAIRESPAQRENDRPPRSRSDAGLGDRCLARPGDEDRADDDQAADELGDRDALRE